MDSTYLFSLIGIAIAFTSGAFALVFGEFRTNLDSSKPRAFPDDFA